MSAIWEVQEAIYNVLDADATLNAMIEGIFDEPPTNQEQNYIVIGDTVETNDDNHCRLGYETYLTLVIYTKPEGLGYYTASKILERINELIHTKKIDMENLKMLMCEYNNSSKFKKEEIRGIYARYKITSEQTTTFTF